MLIAFAATAQAQQRTYYDASGKAATRSTTDSAGTVTTYDAASGKVIARESKGTIYGSDGRVVGKVTRSGGDDRRQDSPV